MADDAPDILRASHIVLPGVGPITERRLWADGVDTLEAFAAQGHIAGFSPERKRVLNGDALRAAGAHAQGDAPFFASRLPHGEAWRMYGRFAGEAAYLDIETSGLSRYSAITVVGIYRPAIGFLGLVRGRTLSAGAISEALEGAKLLVTFNGAGFDLPFIRASFPSARLPAAHLDLLSCARRLGWRGGLKAIERQLGVTRDLETRVLAGSDAVRLWRTFERTGSENALRLLVGYNRADCENLEPVAGASVGALLRRLAPLRRAGLRQAALPAA
jgi:uncharacterized protein YprB with RNaseH-like and TPR domain